MEIQSEAIDAKPGEHGFLARITIGTRARKEVMHEWPAASLRDAQVQADAWLHEYSARLGLGDPALMSHAAVADRASILHDQMPALPQPCEAYNQVKAAPAPAAAYPGSQARKQRGNRRDSYAASRHIKEVVEAARRAGLKPSGIRVWPDGSVAVFEANADLIPPAGDERV